MWEQLLGMKVDLTKISHLDAMERLVSQKNDPQYDLMITNTNAEPEIVRESGVFDPYRAKGATQYADWLRAPHYSWLSISALPRAPVGNWGAPGGGPGQRPERFRGPAAPRVQAKVLDLAPPATRCH